MRIHLDLDVAAGPEVEVGTLGKLQHQFLDEGRDTAIGAYPAFPLADREDLRIQFELHVLLDVDLAGEAVAFFRLPLGDVRGFGRQDVAAAGLDLDLALGAGPAATTGRRDEDEVVAEHTEQFVARVDGEALLLVSVDAESDLPGRDQPRPGDQDKYHQQHDDHGEDQEPKADFNHRLTRYS